MHIRPFVHNYVTFLCHIFGLNELGGRLCKIVGSVVGGVGWGVLNSVKRCAGRTLVHSAAFASIIYI